MAGFQGGDPAISREEDLRGIYRRVADIVQRRNVRRQRWKITHYVLLLLSTLLAVATGITILMDSLTPFWRALLSFAAAASATLVAVLKTEERQVQSRRLRGEWDILVRDLEDAVTGLEAGEFGEDEARAACKDFRQRWATLQRHEDGITSD